MLCRKIRPADMPPGEEKTGGCYIHESMSNIKTTGVYAPQDS